MVGDPGISAVAADTADQCGELHPPRLPWMARIGAHISVRSREKIMNTPALTVGSYVAQVLAANGIDTVFGIPGVHALELYRGLAASGLRHVLVRHEQAAGFAADGYARITGHPAAAFVISGPGSQTFSPQPRRRTRTRCLCSSSPARRSAPRSVNAAECCTSFPISTRWLRRCSPRRTARARCRTCAIICRRRSKASAAAGRGLRILRYRSTCSPRTTALRAQRFTITRSASAPPAEQVDAARALLDGAERPLIIAGGGAKEAAAALLQLVETVDGFLVTTTAGKGILGEAHPANLGASLPYAAVQELIASADVVIAVGTELSETDVYTSPQLPSTPRSSASMSTRQSSPTAIKRSWPFCADAATTVAAIGTGARSRSGWRSRSGSAAPCTALDSKRVSMGRPRGGCARYAPCARHYPPTPWSSPT